MIKDRVNNKQNQLNKIAIALPIIIFGCIFLFFAIMFSVTQGAASISLSTVIDAFTSFETDNPKHLLIMDMRLPRVFVAAIVGSALAVSGAIMQGLTRNPLADSGLMGLSSGAALAIAICFAFIDNISYTQMVLMSFIGAGIGASSVYIISSAIPGGNSSMKLILAGATVTALFSALSQGISIIANVTQNVTFWTMGSVAGSQWKHVSIGVPIITIAIILAIIISGKITIMSIGEEIAIGLGLNTKAVKFFGTVIVVLLAGTSVALAGMITFVGMLIPHFARFLVGKDYRLIIPVSAVLGSILLVLADIGSKTINPPAEIPIGAIISLLGVPVFLYLARKKKGGI
ncbi:MAG: iron ABC transporter permease [Firmicutes bacterium]|nr:iron ABC transporter permease [Bacillota bacterium]